MSRRNVRQERKAAQERDWTWTRERDEDLEREEIPEDEYQGVDAYAREVKEFRS